MGENNGKLKGIPAGRKTFKRAQYRGKELTSYRLSKAVSQLSDNVFQPIYHKRGIVSAASKRAVLRVLADRYPCIWPSVRRIKVETALSERTVQDALSDLRGTKFITALSSLKGGRSSSVQYVINVNKILDPKPWGVDYVECYRDECAKAFANLRRTFPEDSKLEIEKWLAEDALVRTGKPSEWLDELAGDHKSAREAGRILTQKREQERTEREGERGHKCKTEKCP